MTSSLVGSEMCIRDRTAFASAEEAEEAAAAASAAAGEAEEAVGFAAGAVSYTHLTLPTICSV
eukprot:12484048-Prorocentrum_lima.AAC.1